MLTLVYIDTNCYNLPTVRGRKRCYVNTNTSPPSGGGVRLRAEVIRPAQNSLLGEDNRIDHVAGNSELSFKNVNVFFRYAIVFPFADGGRGSVDDLRNSDDLPINLRALTYKLKGCCPDGGTVCRCRIDAILFHAWDSKLSRALLSTYGSHFTLARVCVMQYDFKGLPGRIKSAREAANKMSREALGKLVGGLSRQAVARWEQPYERDRNSVPDLETLYGISQALRVDFLWLLLGQRFSPDIEGTKGVLAPVYSLEEFHGKKAPLFYRRTLNDSPEKVDGFQVGDLANAPEYKPLDVVITEPCKEPRPKKMMVGRLIEKRMNFFGECVISGYGVGGDLVFDLAPLSEGYPRISSRTEPVDLLAVAVEHQKDLRNH